MFLSDWYCRKLVLTDLPGHDGKMTSHINFILNGYHRPYSAGRDFLYYQSLLNSKLRWAMIWNNEYESAILDNKTVDFYLCPPKQCCCWVYIHHRGPLHCSNIVKGKGFSVARKSTIQCQGLSEFFWKKKWKD